MFGVFLLLMSRDDPFEAAERAVPNFILAVLWPLSVPLFIFIAVIVLAMCGLYLAVDWLLNIARNFRRGSMKTLLCLTLGFLCWTVFAGSAHAQAAAATAGPGGASASVSGAPALQAPPVIIMQDAPRVFIPRVSGGCGGGGVNAFFVGGRGRIRQPRTEIRQRIRTSG
jgi:hypothetical protein